MPLVKSISNLMLKIETEYSLRYFVESGTYHGDSAKWAASHFEHVITIEKNQQLFKETSEKFQHMYNIEFELGDTRELLKLLPNELRSSALFWLDAHWCGTQTYGDNDECPLKEELAVLLQGNDCPFLFIDDARLFLSSPPRPHKIDQWPSIDEIVMQLNASRHIYAFFVFCDVIIIVPTLAKRLVAEYCQEQNTRDWQSAKPSLRFRIMNWLRTLIAQTLLGRTFLTHWDLRANVPKIRK